VADFNQLQRTGLTELVRRMLGEELQFGSASPELGLMLALEIDRPEWFFLRSERLFSTGRLTIAANAGHVSQVDLLNPSNSGIIIVVRYVVLLQTVAGTIYSLMLDGGAAGGAAAQNLVLDQRWPLAYKAAGQNFIGNGAVGVSGNEIDSIQPLSTATQQEFPLPTRLGFILAPGRRANVFSNTQNQAINVIMAGYERIARPEELTF
jgi:hypothetical protein